MSFSSVMWLKTSSPHSSSQQKLIREHCACVGEGTALPATDRELQEKGTHSRGCSSVTYEQMMQDILHRFKLIESQSAIIFAGFSSPFCNPASEKVH